MKKLSAADLKLFDLVDVPVLLLEPDATGKVVYRGQNISAEKVLGIPVEDRLGRSADEVLPGRIGQLINKRYRQTMESGTARVFQVPSVANDVSLQLKISLEPVLGPDGETVQLLGTCREISDSLEIREQQLDLHAQNRELESFINIAAHDLRSPMRTLNSLLELLKLDFVDTGNGKLEIIQQIESVVKGTITMIGDVLKQADNRRQSGTDHPEQFQLKPLLEEILAVLDPTGEHQAESVDCELHGDRTVTQIVLRNLIDNAIKHNRGKSMRLALSVITEHTEQGFYQLRLEDNGSGFPDSATAFSESERQSIDNGGFGLLGVHRLVKARGGTIGAENINTGGAAITFSLPGQIIDGENLRSAAHSDHNSLAEEPLKMRALR